MWWKKDNAGVAERFREQLRKTSVHKKMRTRREEGILRVKNVSSPRREEKFSDLLVLHFNFSLRENCQTSEMLKGKWKDAKPGLILKDPSCRELCVQDYFYQAPKPAPSVVCGVCQ